MKSNISKIYLFFSFILIQIVFIALLLVNIFSINLDLLFNTQKIPQYVQNIYIILLYSCILFNLFYLDKESFLSIFKISKKDVRDLFRSFLYGFVSLIIFYLLNTLLGFSFIEKSIYIYKIPIIFVTSFLIGFSEELLFRNFIFKNLSLELSEKKSLIISSYIYAQLHFLRFDLSLYQIFIPIINLFLVGYLLAYLYKKIGFWYSVGLHSGWVFIISYINQEKFLNHSKEYIFLSGGNYPPSGLICFVILITTIFLLKKKILNIYIT